MADAAKFDKQMSSQNGTEQTLCWCSVPGENIRVDGLGFFEQEGRWNRLPAELEPTLKRERPELLELASHTAGASLRFVTDSKEIWVRAKMTSAPYMAHMTPAGQCGFDCYLRKTNETNWCFRGLTKFPVGDDHLECCLADNIAEAAEVCINLPLYIGVEKMEIGIQPGAKLMPARPYADKKTIAVYGTSIDQGGCASRPGMAFPAILSRSLDREVFNLGFSGNGVGQPSLAEIICRLPGLELLILDIQANAGPQRLLRKNLPAFLDKLRSISPDLSVLVLSATPQADEEAYRKRAGHSFEEDEVFQKQEVERRQKAGDAHIRFASGRELLGTVGTEATVDGIHLTDLGFMVFAKHLEPHLKEML